MTSDLCVKLRSFVRVIFRPGCITSCRRTEGAGAEQEPEEEESRNRKEQQEEEGGEDDDDELQQSGVKSSHEFVTSRPSTDHATKARLQSSFDRSTSSSSSSTKQAIQNIYRKPLSRIGSNPSLRRSRGEPHFRWCQRRFSRRFQLFDSDPGDIHHHRYSGSSVNPPNGPHQAPGPDLGDDGGSSPASQGPSSSSSSSSYRRRVYTMPSSAGSKGQPPHRRRVDYPKEATEHNASKTENS